MKSHIPKNGEDYFCGETSLVAHTQDTCQRCARSLAKLLELVEQAVDAIEQELAAAGEDEVRQHPTLRRKRELIKKIDRLLGPRVAAESCRLCARGSEEQ